MRIWKTILILILFVWGYSDISYAQNENMDSVSYSLGILMAKNLKQQGLTELDAASLAAGVADVVNGNELKIDPNQANAIIQQHMQKAQEKAQAAAAEQFASNREAGENFLAENGTREEVTSTASGLQYEVIKEGTGASPKATDKVTVHYHGTLIDGTVFDSSVERGQPTSFGLNQVISGWTEGLQLMKEGGKYRFFLPYNLAYGPREAGAKIKPYSALIFEVELIKVN